MGQGGTVRRGQHKGKAKAKPPAPVVQLESGDVVALTDHEAAQLKHVDALRAAGGMANRKRARLLVDGIEAGLIERVDLKLAQDGIAETLAIEEARGGLIAIEEVRTATIRRVAEPDDGSFDPLAGTAARDEDGSLIVDVVVSTPLRIDGRDGLRSLFVAGRLREAAYERGLAFRQLHEAAASGLRCSLGGGMGGSTALAACFGEAAARLVVGQARAAFLAVARDVAGERGVRVLQLVAGEGSSISSVAPSRSGAARDREAKRLAKVLDAATPGALACAVDAPGSR